MKLEPTNPEIAVVKPAFAASMRNVYGPMSLADAMQRYSAQRIEEYKAIQISMGRVKESELVDEESLDEQENIGASLESSSPDIKEKCNEDDKSDASSNDSEGAASPN